MKHGDRPLANGSLQRLGTYYMLLNRPYAYVAYIAGGHHSHPPPRSLHLHLVASVYFWDSWGFETLGVWLGRPQHHRTGIQHRTRVR